MEFNLKKFLLRINSWSIEAQSMTTTIEYTIHCVQGWPQVGTEGPCVGGGNMPTALKLMSSTSMMQATDMTIPIRIGGPILWICKPWRFIKRSMDVVVTVTIRLMPFCSANRADSAIKATVISPNPSVPDGTLSVATANRLSSQQSRACGAA